MGHYMAASCTGKRKPKYRSLIADYFRCILLRFVEHNLSDTVPRTLVDHHISIYSTVLFQEVEIVECGQDYITVYHFIIRLICPIPLDSNMRQIAPPSSHDKSDNPR